MRLDDRVTGGKKEKKSQVNGGDDVFYTLFQRNFSKDKGNNLFSMSPGSETKSL